MKTILCTLLLCGSAWASTWTAAQTPIVNTTGVSCGSSSGTSATATFGSSTTSGNPMVMVIHMLGAGATVSGVSGGGGTWIHAPNSLATQSTNISDIWYNLTGTGGGTTITATLGTTNTARKCTVFEFHSTTGLTITYDASNNALRASSNPVVGVSLSITGANDVVVQTETGVSTFTSIDGGYVGQATGSTRATAYLLNAGSVASPNWTNAGNGAGAVSAIAISDGGTAAVQNAVPVIY